MTVFISMLRAVNVGGTSRIKMEPLRAAYEGLGFRDVRSLLQSGNVVFRGGSGKTTEVEALLQKAAAKRFKLTGRGHVRRRKAFKSHILTKKAAGRKRGLAQATTVSKSDTKRVREMLPYA